ncbi:hypothetical protein TYRP_020899 [Tyrophagus putrescentiae]|nr:hypothetical protein TYRP_020899 [Tyrophagus putrescentiae]
MTKANPATSNSEKNQQAPCLPVPKHRSINEYVRESQFLLWIWKVIAEISCIDYEQYLRDGVILCQLIETLAPPASSRPLTGGDDKRAKRENIQHFLDSCKAYGMAETELFEVEDLLSMQDIPKVTRCLYALGKHAAEKFGKPELGTPYDEWLTSQLSGLTESPVRRNGMPTGDDLHVSHVNTNWLKDRLERSKAKAAAAIHRPPKEPILQRTPSKPLSELKAMLVQSGEKAPVRTGPPPMVSLT